MDVPHCMCAQPWVFGSFRTVTAEALSLLRKISHLFYRQFRERDISLSEEDVVLEDVAMGGIGSWPALVLVIDPCQRRT